MAKSINKSSMLQLSSIQKVHKWDFEFLRRPVLTTVINEDIFRAIIKSAETPKYTPETAEFNNRGHKWNEVVNVLTNGTWSFTAYELESSPLRNLMTAWNLALKAGTLSRKDSTADIKISSKDTKGKITHIYILKYWYPTDVQVPEFSSDAGLMETTVSGEYMDLDIRQS